MRRTNTITALIGLVIIAVSAAEASAMYHPTLGRFLQRDPGGGPMRVGAAAGQYADGMNVYQYVRSNPVRSVDPFGLQATKPSTNPATTKCTCWCTEHPDDCYLEYSAPLGVEIGKGRNPDKTPLNQKFFKTYTVKLKSRDSHDLAGCNLHQEAISSYTYINAADAKPETAHDYPKSTHTDHLTSAVKGSVVTTTNPDDYVGAGLEFTDEPGFLRNGGVRLVSKYQFTGNAFVEESPGVKGWIKMNADFDFAGYAVKYSIHSSDSKISLDGTF